MAKKRKKKEETEALQETAAPDNSGNAGRWVAIMLLVLGSGVFLYALTTDGRLPQRTTTPARQLPPPRRATPGKRLNGASSRTPRPRTRSR